MKSGRKSVRWALLSLSLILVSTFSVSAALPQMEAYYSGYSPNLVDLLVTIPSFSIFFFILIDIFFARYMKPRTLIIGGLVLYSVSGLVPVFTQLYPAVLISRFLMGMGIGMVNSQAVSVISLLYNGEERTRLLGLRGSSENLGNAFLTFLAGLLLAHGWTKAFWVYAAGIPILVFFLTAVPQTLFDQALTGAGTHHKERGLMPVDRSQLRIILRSALTCMALIGSHTVLSLKIPFFVTGKGMGTDSMASMVLSAMIVSGIISGIEYRRIRQALGHGFFLTMIFLSVISMAGICLSENLAVLTVMSILFGASYPILVTNAFQTIGEELPAETVSTGTNLVLLGCNLGAFLATYLIMAVQAVVPRQEAPVYTCCAILIVIACAGHHDS